MSLHDLEQQFTRLNVEAFRFIYLGRHKEAIPIALQAYEVKRRLYNGKDHPDVATYLTDLGEMHRQIGDYKSALKFHLQAQDMLDNLDGEYLKEFARIQNNLALVYSGIGKYKEAEDLFVTAQQILTKIHQENTKLYASILNNMGGLYNSMLDYERAEKHYREALDLQRKVLEGKENHPHYIRTLQQIALLRLQQNKYVEVRNLLAQTIGIQCRIFGRNHSDVGFGTE